MSAKAYICVAALTLGSAAAQPPRDSIDVILEDDGNRDAEKGLGAELARQPGWKFRPTPSLRDSDSEAGEWRYKFYAGSDKPLGAPRDTAAIKRLLPSSMPVAIRWISRSVVAVAADCYSDGPSRGHTRCLYVLEKRDGNWQITHHYSHGLPAIVRSNQALELTAARTAFIFQMTKRLALDLTLGVGSRSSALSR